MEKRIDLFDFLRNEDRLETILCYSAMEKENDDTEHTTDLTYMNPTPVKALVRQISPEALRWKYYGIVPSGSIEVIAEKKSKSILLNASKIEYNEITYKTWKDDSKGFALTERTDYILVVLERKND